MIGCMKRAIEVTPSERILIIARQIADNAATGKAYRELIVELIIARRVEVEGHL